MRDSRLRSTAWLVAWLALAGLVLLGCGERSFSASEFVDEANANGATMELGKELITDDESKQLYELRLEPLPAAEPAPGGASVHAGGSLAAYDDGEGAERGVQQCEAAADLLCFRAGNVVIVLEGESVGAEQVALAAALKKMAE